MRRPSFQARDPSNSSSFFSVSCRYRVMDSRASVLSRRSTSLGSRKRHGKASYPKFPLIKYIISRFSYLAWKNNLGIIELRLPT